MTATFAFGAVCALPKVAVIELTPVLCVTADCTGVTAAAGGPMLAEEISAGGTAAADWEDDAVAAHRVFVAHRLSPGGAADLLAATCFVHALACAS